MRRAPVAAVVLVVLSLAMADGVFAAYVLVNESKGPGGYGWQQAYGGDTPHFSRLTASADRDTYDYGYKNIEVFVRLEDYWSQDCGWWYVTAGRAITVTLSNGTTTVNSSGVTTSLASKGGGTITYDWADTNFDTTAPGRWLVTADDGAGGNFTGGNAMQFYIYVRGQLNVTSIATTGSAVGSNVVIDATVKDHTGRTVIGEMTDNANPANNVTPIVTAYVTGPSGTLTVPLSWTGTAWQGTWAGADVTNPGNHKIIVRATDNHDYWIDGRGRSKDIAISGPFPSSFAGNLWLPVLVAIFLLAGRRLKGGGPLLLVAALSFLVMFSAPVGAGDDGRYTESRPTGLELEGESTDATSAGSCADTANQSCHLIDYDFPVRTTDGSADGPDGNYSSFQDYRAAPFNVSHPGEARSPAAFYATWVHQQHGGNQWVTWMVNATGTVVSGYFVQQAQTTDIRFAREDDVQTGGITDYQVTSRWGTASGKDHSVGRSYIEIGYGTGDEGYWWERLALPQNPFYLTAAPFNNADPKVMAMPTCGSGFVTDQDVAGFGGGAYGCHGIYLDDSNQYHTRSDPVDCTKCHTGVTADSTNTLHGSEPNAPDGGSCTDCHGGSATGDSDQLDDSATTLEVKECYDTACHDSSRVSSEVNVTGAHAGKDCRFCHGHGHNITKELNWNTSCGNADSFCHGTDAAVKMTSQVEHNVTAGNSPTCVECHGSSTAHNITIPACVRCHNATATVGASATNGSATVPGWDDSNLYHNGTRNSTGSGMVCAACHNSSSYHSEPGFANAGLPGNGRCSACHNTTNYEPDIRQISETHSNQSCAACHNNGTIEASTSNGSSYGVNTNLHSTGGAASQNITPRGYEGVNESSGWTKALCMNCHNKTGQFDQDDCASCHLNEIHKEQMNKEPNKDGNHNAGGGANCTTSDCHGGDSAPFVNYTSFSENSVHRMLNNVTVPDGTPWYMSACYACHENGTAPASGKHNSPDQIGGFAYNNPATCEACHLNVTGYYENATILSDFSAPQIFEHFPNSTNASSSLDVTNSEEYLVTNTSFDGDTGRNATCEYCHKNDIVDHNDSSQGLGSTPSNRSQWRANISHYGGNTTLINGSECLWCHGTGTELNRSKYGVGAYDIFDALNPVKVHDSGYTSNSDCEGCHHNTYSANLHNQSLDLKGGNASCATPACHRTGTTPEYADVDFVAFETSIHRWINNASDYAGWESYEVACRGCHVRATGSVADGGEEHHNAYRLCWDCHNDTSYAYGNVSNAPVVYEHYSNGQEFQVLNSSASINASCIACHIKDEMMVLGFTDDPSLDMSTKNGSMFNISHYGNRRSNTSESYPENLRYLENSNNVTSCTYCHWNASTAFATGIMGATNRTGMANHTDRSGGPTCSNDTACHNQGRMHDAGLTRPTYNNSLCTTCHDSTSRQNHSASKSTGGVNCTQCHTNSSDNGWDIHGTNGTYLQDDGANYGANTSAVNCSTCHQNTTNVLVSPTPPRVNMPMNHSNNESSGQLWGDYWSDTDQNSSCYYCHGDTLHNRTGLGSVAQINGAVNNSIDNASSAWCRACHQNDSSALYIGEYFSPPPPDITNQTGAEETKLPDYFENHSSSYLGNDSTCLSCHKPDPEPANISDFMHNVKIGVAGGINCTSCHDLGGSAPVKVNVSAMNSTNAIHAQLNNRTDDNGTAISSATSDQNNRKCWACHSNGTNPEDGHNKSVYKDPWTCPDCHVNTSSMIYNTLNWSARTVTTVTEHFLGGSDIQAAASSSANKTSCADCHQNTSIWQMLLPNATVDDPDTGSFDPYGTGGGGNMSASHYGRINGTGILSGGIISTVDSTEITNCSYCHQNTSTLFGAVMSDSAYHSNIPNHNNSEVPYCSNSSCHGAGRLHDSALTIPFKNSSGDTGGMFNSTLCQNCHTTKELHAESDSTDLSCASCHSDPSVYNASITTADTYATLTFDIVTNNSNWGNETPVAAKVGDPPVGEASLNTEPQVGADNLVSGVASTAVNIIYASIVDVLVTIFDSIQVSKEVAIPTQIDTTGAGEAAKVVINRAAKEPEFIINGNDKVSVSIVGPDGAKIKLDKEVVETGSGYSVKLEKDRAFKPGIYKLQVETTKNGVTTVEEQDFEWGVLAVNTHKSVYGPDEQAFIGIGVLDNEGRMVCDADVTLAITDPRGDATTLSTANGKIYVSDECEYYGVTDLPDYYTYYTTGDVGTYTMELTAVTKDGTRELADAFEVKENVPYDVARSGPTRIYPLVPYTMEFTIKPNNNYNGQITEYVPAGFEITPQEGMTIATEGDTKALTWNKELTKGKIYTLEYEFDAPDVSPEFYVLGPLEIGAWTEARQWQIASDVFISVDLDWYSSNTEKLDPDATYTTLSGCLFDDDTSTACSNAVVNTNGGGGNDQTVKIRRSSIDPSTLSALTVRVWTSGVTDCAGAINIHAYQSDGTTVNSTALVQCSVAASTSNDCDISSIIPYMEETTDYSLRIVEQNQLDCQLAEVDVEETVSSDDPPVTVRIDAPLNNTWNGSSTINFSVYVDDDNGFTNLTLYNTSDGTALTSNTSVVVDAATNVLKYTFQDDGTYAVYANATDTAPQSNQSVDWTVKIDTTVPVISGTYVNDTDINQNEWFCVNATITDAQGNNESYIAEINNTGATLVNYTMTDTGSSCGAGNDVYGVDIQATNSGTYNFTKVYANDTLNNRDYVYVTPEQTITVNAVVKQVFRYYVKFDLSSIPAGATIDVANLSLNVTVKQTTADKGVVNGTNGEYDSSTDNSTIHAGGTRIAGGTFDAATTGLKNITVTSVVSTALQNGQDFVAFQVREADETSQNFTVAGNGSTDADERPQLYIKYSTAAQKQIHGIRYVTQSGGYSSAWDNTSAANCTSCHDSGGSISYVNGTATPRVPSPMMHSNGSMWNQTPGYWDINDNMTACAYCHGDTKHNATALGNVSDIQGSNSINSSLTDGATTWCKACHYNDSTPAYKGGDFSPRPPEISNDTGYFEEQFPNLYTNHSGTGYLGDDFNGNDTTCFNCHKGSVGDTEGMDVFMHKASAGVAGGINCTSCHDLGGSASKHVNFSAMNSTDAIHAQLNNRTDDNGTAISSATSDQNNRKCWACHSNGTNPEDGHNTSRYKNPWTA
jgi:hypothetical protein